MLSPTINSPYYPLGRSSYEDSLKVIEADIQHANAFRSVRWDKAKLSEIEANKPVRLKITELKTDNHLMLMVRISCMLAIENDIDASTVLCLGYMLKNFNDLAQGLNRTRAIIRTRAMSCVVW